MNNRNVLLNAISSIICYGLLLIPSIISSKYIILCFGSETNGLLSSVNQIYSYVALLEAGIGVATLTALYRPISEKDIISTGNVLASARLYYRTSAKWYFLCVLAVSFVWPLLLDTYIPYWVICGVIFFHGVAGVITYWFTSTIVMLLRANSRNYINNVVVLLTTLLSHGLTIVICISGASIVFISLAMVCVNIVKCIFYYLYARKHCPEYFIATSKPDKSLLKQRGSIMLHELSSVIFSSTDTILLSVFCSLSDASIYAVYAMVLGALRSIIRQAFNGTNYILGSKLARDRDGYPKTHDTYNEIYICIVFAIFTTAYILIIPFISVYTAGVTDANYLDPKLPMLFILIELLSSCRMVDAQLITNALHAKQTVSRTMLEAAINLIVSLVAVQFIGIYGVLLGTIAALLYRTNDIIIYSNIRILQRKPIREYTLYTVNFLVFALLVLASRRIPIAADSYLKLLGVAFPVGISILLIYAAVNLLANRIIAKLSRRT